MNITKQDVVLDALGLLTASIHDRSTFRPWEDYSTAQVDAESADGSFDGPRAEYLAELDAARAYVEAELSAGREWKVWE